MNLEPGSPREHVWYNHLCQATPLPTKVDPYDGKEKSFGVNDLGGEYFTDKKFQYCRNVNDGKCTKFESVEVIPKNTEPIMAKALTESQKRYIDAILLDEEGFPGDVTYMMEIKRILQLSDEEVEGLSDAIESYLLSHFSDS